MTTMTLEQAYKLTESVVPSQKRDRISDLILEVLAEVTTRYPKAKVIYFGKGVRPNGTSGLVLTIDPDPGAWGESGFNSFLKFVARNSGADKEMVVREPSYKP